MRVRILPYGPSASARALSRETGIRRVNLVRTRFRIDDRDFVINWGASKYPMSWYRGDHSVVLGKVLNEDVAVERASSKRRSLQVMQQGGVNVPHFTTDRQQAQRWYEDGTTIVCRTLDRANSGRGIILQRPGVSGESIPQAGLYVKYIPKRHEYRLHVWGNQVLDIQQKRKRNGVEDANFQIRNAVNGWAFCREGVEAPDEVVAQSIAAVRALGLDFGAVDVGWNEHHQSATVYEVNTAPGLEGTTLLKYAASTRAAVERLQAQV